jgi:hypothetical protein
MHQYFVHLMDEPAVQVSEIVQAIDDQQNGPLHTLSSIGPGFQRLDELHCAFFAHGEQSDTMRKVKLAKPLFRVIGDNA